MTARGQKGSGKPERKCRARTKNTTNKDATRGGSLSAEASAGTPFDRWKKRLLNKWVIALVVMLAVLLSGVHRFSNDISWIVSILSPKGSSVTTSIDREALTQKIYEVARIIQKKDTTDEERKLALDFLIQHGENAVPQIVGLAAKHVFAEPVDKYDPNFLVTITNRIVQDPDQLVEQLFSAVSRVGADSSGVRLRKYFQELFTRYDGSPGQEKEALLAAYHFSGFNGELRDTVARSLKGGNLWDPVKKVLLRALLRSPDSGFALEGHAESETEPEQGNLNAMLASSMIRSMGFADMQNAQVLFHHIENHVYGSFIEYKNTRFSDGTRAEGSLMRYDRVRAELEPYNATYLFGFDFFRVPVYSLTLRDVLLGKSFFVEAGINNLTCLESTLLECNLAGSDVGYSRFSHSRMVGCDLGKSTLRCLFSDRGVFSDCNFVGTTLNSCCFVDSSFRLCQIEELLSAGTIFLHCAFNTCKGDISSLVDTVVDETTFKALAANGGFDFSGAKIEKVSVSEIKPTDFRRYLITAEYSSSPSAEQFCRARIADLGILHMVEAADYPVLKRYLEGQTVFVINRRPPPSLSELKQLMQSPE